MGGGGWGVKVGRGGGRGGWRGAGAGGVEGVGMVEVAGEADGPGARKGRAAVRRMAFLRCMIGF